MRCWQFRFRVRGPGRMAAPRAGARAVGARAARALWLILWAAMAYFALLPANRGPQALPAMLSGTTGGEPAWLASISQHGAALLAHQGLAASVVLAVLMILIAIGVYLPPSAARAALALAAALAAAIWVAGQDLGGILTGSGTDPESGPLLILLVLAYWPVRSGRARPDEAPSHGPPRAPPTAASDWPRPARTIRSPAAGRTLA